MAEVRAEGVATAILFASGPAACRAYEAIGFQRIGTYMLSILEEPAMIKAAEVSSVTRSPAAPPEDRPDADWRDL